MDRLSYITGVIGRPYRIGARGPDAFDCYGLVRFVLGELQGLGLPDDLGRPIVTTRDQAEAMLSHPERENWMEIPAHEAQDLDLILMGNVLGRDFHLGLFMQAGSNVGVLHVDQTRGVVFDDMPSLKASGFNYLRAFRRG